MLEYSSTFLFQLSQNAIGTRFWMTPIDSAILVAAKNAIKIWRKTGTDSRRGLERICLHTVYRTINVARIYQGGWTEHTQRLMKESFPEKFVLVAFITVVTATLQSTYGIAAPGLLCIQTEASFILQQPLLWKKLEAETQIFFLRILYIIEPWPLAVCLACRLRELKANYTNTSRMKQLLNSSSLFNIFHLEY